jgi:hypothetical protein
MGWMIMLYVVDLSSLSPASQPGTALSRNQKSLRVGVQRLSLFQASAPLLPPF